MPHTALRYSGCGILHTARCRHRSHR